jgi:membrane-associated phospholipid phosphatase
LCLDCTAISQEKNRPYTIGWSIDGPIIGAAAAVAISASTIDDHLSSLSLGDIQSLNKNDINALDRISAGRYSKNQSMLSDVLVGGSILSPFLFVFDPEVRSDITTLSTMYLETVMFATFMPSYGKGLVRRIRPYAYGSGAPLSEKQNVETLRSFYSGHATWAFATSIFFASVYTEYHPESKYTEFIWGGAIGLASTVSILRVTSGAHFLSDIAVGAAVGSSIGYLIPYFHRTENTSLSIHPLLGPNYAGASFTIHLK